MKHAAVNLYAFFATLGILFLGSQPAYSQCACQNTTSISPLPVQSSSPRSPDFSVPTLDGKTFSLSAHRGQPVVLYAMASWCATCVGPARNLAKLYRIFGDSIAVVALDVDPSTTQEDLERFKSLAGDPGYVWAFDKGGTVVRDYRIMALETTIIFDKTGAVAFTATQSASLQALQAHLQSLLK